MVREIRLRSRAGRYNARCDLIAWNRAAPQTVIEVKTSAWPPRFHGDQLQICVLALLGDHVVALDLHVWDVGLTPNALLPPLQVLLIYAPAPKQRYEPNLLTLDLITGLMRDR